MKRFSTAMVPLVLSLSLFSCGEEVVGDPMTDAGSDGRVTCGAGEALCGTECVDVSSDPARCGDCETSCGASEVCSAGVCATSCPPGQEACDGGCFDTGTSRAHCGACGVACGDGEETNAERSTCTAVTCSSGIIEQPRADEAELCRARERDLAAQQHVVERRMEERRQQREEFSEAWGNLSIR